MSEEEKIKYAEFDSKECIENLAKAIEENGHEVEIINIESQKNIKDVLETKKNNVDLVFNVAEGLEGDEREAVVPSICEELKIPFSAAGSETLITTLNKAKTKELLEKNNIPTPRFKVFNKFDDELGDLKFPLLVKPILEGSSKGIFNENLVENEEKLREIVKKVIEKYKQPAIVEEFINGREFTVSVIGYEAPVVLPIVEIRFDDIPDDMHPMDSYEVKWLHDTPEFIEKHPDKDPAKCPAQIDEELEKKIKETALKTFKVLDCRDWSRIDIRLDRNNTPHILEVNALPGFMKDPKENSRLPKAAYAAGWSYEKLIGEVINSAVKRWML